MEILKVEHLSKVYGKGENAVAALRDVSFSVDKGEFVAIIGSSGSGKSTLIHLIGGVDRPTGGKVFVDGKDVYAQDEEALAIFRRRQVGLIYQFYNLIPVLDVVETNDTAYAVREPDEGAPLSRYLAGREEPLTQEEALEMVREMKPIIDPNIIFFAYFNEEPIGFFITVPDLNRLIGKFNGKFGLRQKLRLMWDLKVRKSCDRIFGIIFGITPEFHGKGVESAIMVKYYEFLEMTKNQYKSMELAWIGDFNPVMNRMIETYVCATRHKVHTTYRYLFDRTKEFHRCPRLGVKRRSE